MREAAKTLASLRRYLEARFSPARGEGAEPEHRPGKA
jgi:hypothetical protein